MASNTDTADGRGVLVVAVTALLVASTVAAGVSLAAVGTVSAQTTQVSSCTIIDEPGTYELAANVSSSDDYRTCLRITASNVTLDGNGYTVDNRGTAIVANGSEELTNVTVRRFVLDDAAIEFDGVSNGTIVNTSVDSTQDPVPGGIGVTGDDNAVTDVTGATQIVMTGDDNVVSDSSITGYDAPGLILDGNGTVVRNVTAFGDGGMDLTGSHVRVSNSRFGGYYGVASAITDVPGIVFVNNTVEESSFVYGSLSIDGASGGTIRGNEFNVATLSIEGNESTIRGNTVDALDVSINGNDSVVRGNTIETSEASVGDDGSVVRGNTIRTYGDPISVTGALVYDNLFNASDVIADGTSSSTRWNVSARPGENIVGGDTLGGNYYVDDEGTGYSQTCVDADGDGFCDEPLRINDSNTDYLPLAEPSNGTEPDDGNDSEANDTYYQVDFVAGQPIEELGENGLYAEEDRLMRFAFGSAEEGVTEKDSAWANESIRSAVDYGHITEHDDGTASVTFTVADGETVTLSLVTYSMPGEEFSTDTVDQQELLNSTTETYGPGEYTITVNLPADDSESDE